MSEAASMAVVLDKRQQQQRHHHGGCVGILFHLFDWNRRRGRLFPKLLPPPKKPPIPFAADEKMPISKLLLMAEEGDGGFHQSAKRPPEAVEAVAPRGLRRPVRDGGTCSPGVVARLMGLETMPVVSRERPRRAVDSACSEASSGSSSRHDLNLEVRGRGRPPKLQRTGASGESAVACGRRIGQEAMQLGRSVISRARKQQRKLASPVKSPRLPSRRNSTRLIEAAVRILEPGLQQRSRARCALTYHVTGRGNMERSELSPGNGKKSIKVVGAHAGPCRSRGGLVESADFKTKNDEDAAVDCGIFSKDLSKMSSSYRVFDNVGTMKACALDGSCEERPRLGATQAKDNAMVRSEELARRRIQCPSKQEVVKGRGDLLGKATIRKNQKMVIRDKSAMRQDLCRRQQARRDITSLSTSKETIVANRKPDVPACARVVSKSSSESVRVGAERVACERKTATKQRPRNGSQVAHQQGPKPNSTSQRNVKHNVVPARGVKHACTSSVNVNCPKNSSTKQSVGSSAIGKKNSNVVSLTFSAPFTHEMQLSSCHSVEKDGNFTTNPLNGNFTTNSLNEGNSQHEGSIADSSKENVPSQRVTTLTGDELSALLEQKIRELNSLHQRAGDGESVVKSTTRILEELISALTKDGVSYQKKAENCDAAGGQGQTDSCLYGSLDPSHGTRSHGCKENAEGTSVLLSSGIECNQPSPVSILEASFSTDSSLSESMFGTSGHEPPDGHAHESWRKSELWDPDADFFDSATSGSSVVVNATAVLPTLDRISIMYGTDGCFGSSKIKPNFAQEVISNTELLLGPEIQDSGGDTVDESPVDALLLDFVELLAAEFDASAKCGPGFMDVKDSISNQSLSRRFLFDCIIENLDIIHCCSRRSNCLSQNKLSLTLSSDQLISKIHADISKCRGLAGKILDDIIDEELKHPKEKWARFEDEALEAGIDIEHDLFLALVDEMALDLLAW